MMTSTLNVVKPDFFARKMCELIHGHRHPKWDDNIIVESKYDPAK